MIYNDLGNAYRELNQHDAAVRHYGLSISSKRNASALTNRANVLLERSDVAGAVADCTQALDLAPKEPRALALRGRAYLRLGRFDSACVDFDHSLAEQKMYETQLMRSVASGLKGDKQVAIEDLQDVADNAPKTSPRKGFAQGMLAWLKGDLATAISELSKSSDDVVLRPFALEFRGLAWAELGGNTTTAAEADAEQVVKEWPAEPLALFMAARIHARIARSTPMPEASQKARDRAADLLAAAVKCEPSLQRTARMLPGIQELLPK